MKPKEEKDATRRRHVRLLAETILYPQEIWEQWEWIYALEIMALRCRYIALWDVGDETRPGLTVFEFTPKRFWSGVTAFVPEDNEKRSWRDYLADQRSGHMRWPK